MLVGYVSWAFLSDFTFFGGYETHKRCEMIKQMPIVPIAICLMIFEAHMNILFIIKAKILLHIKW